MFNDNGGSRTDTLIKLVLVFFLSLLSFSVGTFVGKQFSDSQHKIAEMENNGGDMDRSTASVPPDATKQDPGQAISEEEITKLSDEFIKKEKGEAPPAAQDTDMAKKEVGTPKGTTAMTGPMVGEASKGEGNKTEVGKVVTKKDNNVHDEIAAVSKRIAKDEKVAAPKARPSRIPSSLPKELANSSIGKFTVQISSHPEEGEAKTTAQQLKEKGLSAFYVPAPVGGKTWYRVSVGLFATRKEAIEYRTKLVKDEGLSTAIVQKIVK